MINANELRIGNWVTELIKNRIVSIDGIEPSHEFVWVNYLNGLGQYKVGIDNIEPIPLTPEILEKCGFDKNCILKLSQRLNIEWSYGKEFWLTKEDEIIYYFENIQHLHQLQNLYWYLTNTELNYTP